jgi:hypothetical protein
VIALASRRRRALVMVTSALAVAAAIVLVLRLRREEPIMLAQATSRPIEARLSYVGTDRYRPYDVMRAAGTAREPVPVQSLARLERRGDVHGVGVGYLLSGEIERAQQYLTQAPQAEADVLSDEAAVALAQHDAEAALTAADRALAAAPGHAQALWNKALALRDLGLPLSAAQLFDAVAARSEPGWSEEAARRAAALRAEETERQRLWHQAAQAGQSMITTGTPPPPEVTRAYPGLIRRDLYQAVRSAPSQQRVLALIPVADEVERAGGSGLTAWLRTVASQDLAQRAPLAASYARLLANPGSFTPAAGDALLSSLRKAKEDDLLFGALVLLARVATSRAELRQLAEKRHDPWLIAIVDDADAQAALAKGDAAAAEQLLRDADKRCLTAHVEYQCAFLEYDLADALLRQSRAADAQHEASLGLGRARAAGVDPRDLERRFFVLLAEIARARNLPSLATAYIGEARLHMP